MDYHPQKSARVRALRKKFGRPEWGGKHIHYNPADAKTGQRWIENAVPALRVDNFTERHADNPRGHVTGYYVDGFQNDTTTPAVVQLPGRNGQPQYFPACSDPWNANCYMVDFTSGTEDAHDARQGAHHLAERYAEECRDFCAKDAAEHQIAEAREAITAAREKHSAIVREMQTVRGTRQRDLFLPTSGPTVAPVAVPSICAALRENLADLRREVRDARERITLLTDNYWEAVPS